MKDNFKKTTENLLSSSDEEKAVEYLKPNLRAVNIKAKEVKFKETLYTKYGKRVIDFIIVLPIFILLIPFNAIFAILTFLDVGNPIFFKQERVGKGGNLFIITKFRNMNNKKDSDGRLLPPSKRVTKFGRFMRKYSFDEFLNLLNILKGEMSIIGPRPLPVFLFERMSDRHKQRVLVRPGLECPRVISVYDDQICKYQRTFENDIWYVENVSFFTDIKMFLELIKMVFSFEKRDNQAKGEGVSYFIGYDNNGFAISMNVFRNRYEICGDEIYEKKSISYSSRDYDCLDNCRRTKK